MKLSIIGVKPSMQLKTNKKKNIWNQFINFIVSIFRENIKLL